MRTCSRWGSRAHCAPLGAVGLVLDHPAELSDAGESVPLLKALKRRLYSTASKQLGKEKRDGRGVC